MLNFEEFQNSRQRVQDVFGALGIANDSNIGETVPGFVYADCCYIEDDSVNGGYHLIITTSEYHGYDLSILERRLYDDHYKPEHETYYRKSDGSLDEFIVYYCDQHNIPCDGGVFGILFADFDDVVTEAETIATIERAARIYDLRETK